MKALSLTTDNLLIRTLEGQDTECLLSYVKENRYWLTPWEETHPVSYFTHQEQARLIAHMRTQRLASKGMLLGIFSKIQPTSPLWGRFSLHINATGRQAIIGYSIAEKHHRQGHMHAVLKQVSAYLFEEVGISTLKALVKPENIPSQALLEKSGFRYQTRVLVYGKTTASGIEHCLFGLDREQLACLQPAKAPVPLGNPDFLQPKYHHVKT